MPATVPDEDAKMDVDKDAEEGEEKPEEDDKLYCVCKTKYDEDRVMIACDRYVASPLALLRTHNPPCSCDEWYHTQCVDMPDLEVDLVDQFICPPCIASTY
jgi:COMPASS component SPP1